MKASLKLFFVSFVFIGILIPKHLLAALITPTVTIDTETHIRIEGNGSPINKNKTFVTPVYTTISGFWSVLLRARERDKFNDTLRISGKVTHLKSPTNHGDGAGKGLDFDLFLNADKAEGDPLTVNTSDLKSLPHSIATQHSDFLSANAEADVETDFGADSITGYDFVIDVTHCESPFIPLTGNLNQNVNSFCFVSPSNPQQEIPIMRVPESSSTLGILTLGILGTASTVKHKLKFSKSHKRSNKK